MFNYYQLVMALATKDIFVIGAKRTPFCKFGGSLRELPASYVFASAGREVLKESGLNPSLVDCTIIGNVNFLSQCDGGKTPRYCGIYSGVSIDKPALGVNRTCGSGLQSIISGAIEILTGQANVVLSGGTEVMSSLPFLVRNLRFGSTLGKMYHFEDYIKTQIVDTHIGLSLHQIAENIAKRYNINREMVDRFALNSRLKWKAGNLSIPSVFAILHSARETKLFEDEIAPVTDSVKDVIITEDDCVDENRNIEEYVKAPASLDDGKIVTPLNSTVAADGAAALLLASERSIIESNIRPLARLVGIASVGVDPVETGLGAVLAIRKLLEVMKLEPDDVDLFEINETFASQTLATMKLLKLPEDKVNVSGGALALGHPVAASGARLAVHLVHRLRGGSARRVLAASSCGGGQGVAAMFESV
nr:3-ketoacyl-CoA thiolase, mitochondrial-like [Danaus plexippus plexippus]